MLRFLASLTALALTAGFGYSVRSSRLVESNETHFQVIVDELTTAAKERGVEIVPDQVSYLSLGKSFVAHAAIQGADDYTDEELAKGANIGFVFTQWNDSLPSDFYTVRATLPVGAVEGEVQFIDGSGRVVRKSPLLIRTLEEVEHFNPTPGGHDPVAIPNVTSTHVYRGGTLYLDCSSRDRTRVMYYPMS